MIINSTFNILTNQRDDVTLIWPQQPTWISRSEFGQMRFPPVLSPLTVLLPFSMSNEDVLFSMSLLN